VDKVSFSIRSYDDSGPLPVIGWQLLRRRSYPRAEPGRSRRLGPDRSSGVLARPPHPFAVPRDLRSSQTSLPSGGFVSYPAWPARAKPPKSEKARPHSGTAP